MFRASLPHDIQAGIGHRFELRLPGGGVDNEALSLLEQVLYLQAGTALKPVATGIIVTSGAL